MRLRRKNQAVAFGAFVLLPATSPTHPAPPLPCAYGATSRRRPLKVKQAQSIAHNASSSYVASNKRGGLFPSTRRRAKSESRSGIPPWLSPSRGSRGGSAADVARAVAPYGGPEEARTKFEPHKRKFGHPKQQHDTAAAAPPPLLLTSGVMSCLIPRHIYCA